MPSLYVKESKVFARSALLAQRDLTGMVDDAAQSEAASTELVAPKGDCIDLLTRMVEGEIIPRLLMAHQNAPPPVNPLSSPSFGPETTDEFAQMVLSTETDTLIGYVSGLMARGVSIQAIYMDLLAPTARKLGDYWNADYCTFADVTIGLGKLQHILHDLSRRDTLALERQRQGRSVLLATASTEQHTFGLLVIEEFFRRAGWRTWAEPGADPDEIARMVSGQWYDLFGLSVSGESHLDQTAAIITSVRKSSRNRMIRVMVGGRVFMENPGLAASVGADVTASGGNEAVAAAESAVSQLEGRC
jgi:MerR family transcriptional regulator, light-induced transcriptional regulator